MNKNKILVGIVTIIVVAVIIIFCVNLGDRKEEKTPIVGQFSLTYKEVEIIPGNHFNDEKVSASEVVSYENTLENVYVYKRGNVSVSFLVENDVITSIEYTLNTAN